MSDERSILYSYPKWLNRSEYPFNGKFYSSSIGRMHFVDEGSGDPIVMVHGNPAWSFMYRKLIKGLSNDYRCIAPDLLGFGFSDKPMDWDYFPYSHSLVFDEFIENLGLNNITLVVNDWGGPIGISYAIKNPLKIKKLVVLNSFLWCLKGDKHFERFSKIMGGPVGKFLIMYFNFFGKNVVKKAVGNYDNLGREIHKHYYLHLDSPSSRKACFVFPKQLMDSNEWLDYLWNQRIKIANIPALFFWGMKDIAFREKELNKWTTIFENYRMFKLENVGHFPAEEKADVIISEINN